MSVKIRGNGGLYRLAAVQALARAPAVLGRRGRLQDLQPVGVYFMIRHKDHARFKGSGIDRESVCLVAAGGCEDRVR